MNSIRTTIIFLVFFTIFFCGYKYSFAASDSLPDMMVGQTTVYDSTGMNVVGYGGMTGNYAVSNDGVDSDYGFGLSNLQLDNQVANHCLGSKIPLCFILGTGKIGTGNAGTNKLMTSRTRIDSGNGTEVAVYELPALYFGAVNIEGDVYSTDMSNFAFWGKNLAQGADATDKGATWSTGSDYAINRDAQSYWKGGENEFTQKIDSLGGITLTDATAGTFNLQSSNIATPSTDESGKYPEGKVWVYKHSLTNIGSKFFEGRGTIIVKGNLTFAPNCMIKEVPNSDSKLGFIVTGNVTIGAGCEIHAPIFTKGSITINSNTKLYGSYVAKTFYGINTSSNTNINVFYDYNLDDAWPPGFRYLDMPKPKESGN